MMRGSETWPSQVRGSTARLDLAARNRLYLSRVHYSPFLSPHTLWCLERSAKQSKCPAEDELDFTHSCSCLHVFP